LPKLLARGFFKNLAFPLAKAENYDIIKKKHKGDFL